MPSGWLTSLAKLFGFTSDGKREYFPTHRNTVTNSPYNFGRVKSRRKMAKESRRRNRNA